MFQVQFTVQIWLDTLQQNWEWVCRTKSKSILSLSGCILLCRNTGKRLVLILIKMHFMSLPAQIKNLTSFIVPCTVYSPFDWTVRKTWRLSRTKRVWRWISCPFIDVTFRPVTVKNLAFNVPSTVYHPNWTVWGKEESWGKKRVSKVNADWASVAI